MRKIIMIGRRGNKKKKTAEKENSKKKVGKIEGRGENVKKIRNEVKRNSGRERERIMIV